MKKTLKTAGIVAIILAGVGAVVFAVKAILDYRAAMLFMQCNDGGFEDDEEFEDENFED